jgi:N-acetyl-gamma-glutamyl-phosphate reductase
MRVMHNSSVALFGASGYAGMELTALLAAHPAAKLGVVASDRHAGSLVEDVAGVPGAAGRLRYLTTESALAQAGEHAVAILATPAEASLALVPELVRRGCRIVDLSGAFRLRDASAFTRSYQLEAAPTVLMESSVYGLPELARDAARGATIVANPGCYPTAAILALGPLLRAELVDPDDLVVDAMSGVTGAGRKADEAYGFVAVHADARAYKVLTHQHTPEIEQGLASFAGRRVSVTFTPHLVPIARGILATSYARLTASARGATSADLTEVLRAAYRGERFVKVAATPEDVDLRKVVGTNDCLLGVACEAAKNGRGGRVVVVSAIDNLLKGAAGQALQNLNAILGCEESAGLVHLRRALT